MAFAASATESLAAFWLFTRSKLYSSPEKLITQATTVQNYLVSDLMKGRDAKKMFQDGKNIVDYILLSFTDRAAVFNPTADFAFEGTENGTEIGVPWRYIKVDDAINEIAVEQQGSNEATTFKRIVDAKDANMQTAFWEKMESLLWQTPDNATMESSTALGSTIGQPMSIRAYITDDGLAPSSTNGGVQNTTNWTTVLGVATSNTNWRNQYETFDNTSQATRENTLLDAFDNMWLDLDWTAPDTLQKYFEDPNLARMKIVCNKVSYQQVVRLCRQNNTMQSPKGNLGEYQGNVTYNGIPFKRYAKLDGIDLTTSQYKYRWLNLNFMKYIFHTNRMRKLQKFSGAPTKPLSTIMLETTAFNLWCNNRKAQGIVRAA